MTHKLAVFSIAWLVLLILAIVSCMAGGWSEDTALLGAAYTLAIIGMAMSQSQTESSVRQSDCDDSL